MALDNISVRISKKLYEKINRIRAKLILRGIDPHPTNKFITEMIAEKIDAEEIVNEIV